MLLITIAIAWQKYVHKHIYLLKVPDSLCPAVWSVLPELLCVDI